MSQQDPCTTSVGRRRAAVVGLGARARMFTEALTGPFEEGIDLVGLCDTNAHRMAVHNSWITADHPDRPPVPAYAAEEFDEMLRRERVDLVPVCSVDRFHDHCVVRALEAGCDVVTEKPMTTDGERARRILEARRRTGREVRVCFNYRYNRVHSAVRELIAVRTTGASPVMHGVDGGDEAGRTELLVRRHWERPREVKVATGEGGHGGGDVRMLADLFGERVPDGLGRAADAVDGARSLVTGLAANRSLETGTPVRARELLDV